MATVNDSGIPFGSAVLTVNGVAFIGENISTSEPSATQERRDENGAPSGQVTVAGFITGSATIQFATTSTVAPTIGATFAYTNNGGVAGTYYVSEIGQAVSLNEIKKATISFRKQIN
jgi:hypothetical protein